MKRVLNIIIYLLLAIVGLAQDSTVPAQQPVIVAKPIARKWAKKPLPKPDSVALAVKDSVVAVAFEPDSSRLKDSVWLAKRYTDSLHTADSVKKAMAAVQAAKLPAKDTSTYWAIETMPYLPFGKPPVFFITNEHLPQTKDALFYILVATIGLFAIVKVAFPKYLGGLFSQFFQTSFRQKYGRDQLSQDNLPSILMNALFVLSGGIYAALIINQRGWIHLPFLQLLMYSLFILLLVYVGKYLFLLFIGWVFNVSEAANQYIFVVFLSNKVAAICLLPFLLIAAFTGGQIAVVGYTVSMALIVGLLVYRYLINMGTMRNSLNVNALHFFLYLCAIEVLPLLLIYKAFFKYIA